MQPTPESFTTPRRPLDVDDYIDVLRRHKVWILGPTFAALVISVVVAFLWPDTFVSSATIRIVPAQVPERFVPTNVNMQIGQRMAALVQVVTGREQLEGMINSLGLYAKKRTRLPMEDVIEDMVGDIKIQPISMMRTSDTVGVSSTAFRIQFAYDDRYVAQKVVQTIVGKLLGESLANRESQSVQTTQFLADQLAQAKRDLEEIDNRLTQYKIRFAGRLPDQLNANLQQLRTLETRLGSTGSSISRVSQDKLSLESQLRIFREQKQALSSAPASSMETAVKNERLLQLERSILGMESALSGLRQQYKDTHPDIRQAQAKLDAMKKDRDALLAEEKKAALAAPGKEAAPPPSTPQTRGLDANIQRVQSMIQAKDMELEQYVKEQSQIDQLIKQYQTRIESSPLAEREYAELVREYNLAKQQYDDLSIKRSQSEIATDLESRKQGEFLEQLDGASLPVKPTEPKRWLIVSVGVAIGLMLGLFLAGGREMKDTSLKNLKDVRAYTNLAVLGSIPLLENDLVVRRKRRLTWLAWSTATIFGVLTMVGTVYYYYTKGSW